MATTASKLDLIRSVDALKINPLTRQALGRGQHIYAYCNVRTNQVIYSLTQILRPHKNLNQLPNAGNNTKPPKLRKDHWQPLWTLTLPTGFQGEAQGLKAWERLNALRYMHERYWMPPKELGRNHTKEELEEIQDRIEDRGGSKKENVYDVIKREKKKLRLKQVMNQKANSIADLAAVLVEQEKVSEEDAGEYTYKETQTMLELDEAAKRGALERLEEDIDRLGLKLKELLKATPVTKEKADSGVVINLARQRNRTRRDLRSAQEVKAEMEHAVLMVSYGEDSLDYSDSGVADELIPEREAHLTRQHQQLAARDFRVEGDWKHEVRRLRREEPESVEEEDVRLLKIWQDSRIKFLTLVTKGRFDAKAERGYYDTDTDTQVNEPAAKAAREARDVLLPPGEVPTTASAEELEELRAERVRALEGMVEDSKKRLAEAGYYDIEPTLIKPDLTRRTIPKDSGNNIYRHFIEIRVWYAMIKAYELTGGTLEVRNPVSRKIIPLGYRPPKNPRPEQSSVANEQVEVETEAKGNVTEGVAVDVEHAEPDVDQAHPVTQEADNKIDDTVSRTDEVPRQPAEARAKPKRTLQPPPLRLRIPKPAFNMEDVKVTWQNILDAEFAPVWPAAVQHEYMGITRYAAPKPGAEPKMTAQEYYEGKLRPKAEVEEEAPVREGIVASVTASIISRLVGGQSQVAKKELRSSVVPIATSKEKERVKEA